jgi:phage shock protein A
MKQIRQRLGEAASSLVDAQTMLAVEVGRERTLSKIIGADTSSKIVLDEAAELVALALGMIRLANEAIERSEVYNAIPLVKTR